MIEDIEKKGFIGIDVGTQGIRLILVDQQGNEIFNGGENLTLTDHSREEQSPEEWWQASLRLLTSMSNSIKSQFDKDLSIESICVTSTSGTVIPLNKENQALHPAIMYSDQRSAKSSIKVREAAEEFFSGKYGYTSFNSSSGLSKMVWFVENFPDKAKEIKYWVHAADYITGQLSGCFHITDYTNALKSGYDVKNKEWSSYIYEKLPIKKEWLQAVVPTGQSIGFLKSELQKQLGLNANIQVVTGLTDGCASQIASGAVEVGDWNTTSGTTMVIKGITTNEINDPKGRIYSHRHPQGYWMPGGAANIGADWVNDFSADEVKEYSRVGEDIIPTKYFSYPLRTLGERFPFIAPEAKGFEQEALKPVESFVSNMEGLAYIERYAYELIENLSGEKVKTIFTAGGASNNELWMKIRSNVLNLPIKKMKNAAGVMGAAIMAASQTHFKNLVDAANSMTSLEIEFCPDPSLSNEYTIRYHQFIDLLIDKNYIKKENNNYA